MYKDYKELSLRGNGLREEEGKRACYENLDHVFMAINQRSIPKSISSILAWSKVVYESISPVWPAIHWFEVFLSSSSDRGW